MTRELNLDDIQGNIVRAYGRYSYPVARYFFLQFEDTVSARAFVDAVRPKVTTAQRWTKEDMPPVTLNIGFTFWGLWNLGLPTRTLQQMPSEFIEGMKARAFVLGDKDPTLLDSDDQGWQAHWDPVWQENRTDKPRPNGDVHVWISMNAHVKPGTDEAVPELEEQTQWLRDLCRKTLKGRVRILDSNGRGGDQEYQQASAIFATLPDGSKVATPKEHFGFTDGIGNPVFDGQFADQLEGDAVIGRGKWMDAEKGWQPLATGEFLLGHPDESQELPPTAMPPEFMQNGSFMVYRKLHENVGTFKEVLAEEAKDFAATMGISEAEANVTLQAKMVGRWPDGVPLSKVPTYDAWVALAKERGFDNPETAGPAYREYLTSKEARDFLFGDDIKGFKCPSGAHLRRVNTRDYLDPQNDPDGTNPDATTQLNKRRRILRRGLPYGPTTPGAGSDDEEQGIIFMAVCASIFRQFEFVQQQWIEYGLDFNAGNNTCPLVGSHKTHTRHVIPADPSGDTPPYVMNKLKSFVETRGGDYFFIPSLTALRLMSMGIVDPT